MNTTITVSGFVARLGGRFAPALLVFAALACTGEGVKSGGGGGGGADELPCNPSKDCPNGQFCFNGICALGCNSNSDCADDQYCDTEWDRLCHNKTVSTCPDTPCAEGQICKNGFCSTPPVDTMCTPRPDGKDGCDTYSICLEEDDETTQCYSFPSCPESGVCPTGLVGAVCNNGIIPNKAHICLTGLCKEASHCPSSWSCVRGSSDPVGFCSDGSAYSLCGSDDDCQEGLACDAFVGLCTTAGGGGGGGGQGSSCSSDDDCADGLTCDEFAGICF